MSFCICSTWWCYLLITWHNTSLVLFSFPLFTCRLVYQQKILRYKYFFVLWFFPSSFFFSSSYNLCKWIVYWQIGIHLNSPLIFFYNALNNKYTYRLLFVILYSLKVIFFFNLYSPLFSSKKRSIIKNQKSERMRISSL